MNGNSDVRYMIRIVLYIRNKVSHRESPFGQARVGSRTEKVRTDPKAYFYTKGYLLLDRFGECLASNASSAHQG